MLNFICFIDPEGHVWSWASIVSFQRCLKSEFLKKMADLDRPVEVIKAKTPNEAKRIYREKFLTGVAEEKA